MELKLKLAHNNITLSLGCVKIKKCICMYVRMYGGGVVIKALCYKPAGRGLDSRWCHWNFSVT
jgi:hypothetical protein